MKHHDDTKRSPPPCYKCGKEGHSYNERSGNAYCIACAMQSRDRESLQIIGCRPTRDGKFKTMPVETPRLYLRDLWNKTGHTIGKKFKG